MYIKIIRLKIDDYATQITGEYNYSPEKVKTHPQGQNEVILRIEMGGDTVQTKVYVQVMARVTPNGYIVPQQIRWVDHVWHKIDQVLDCRDMRETKQGGDGWRYRVRIRGKVIELYQHPDRRWYVISGATVDYDSGGWA